MVQYILSIYFFYITTNQTSDYLLFIKKYKLINNKVIKKNIVAFRKKANLITYIKNAFETSAYDIECRGSD